MEADNVNSGSLSQTVQFAIASVAMCLLCSLLFFFLGNLYHYYCQRKKHPVVDQQSPVYDEIHALRRQSEQIDIKENEAYGPLNLLNH